MNKAINYWICTERLRHGGKKVLGPFSTQKLALQVRTLLEFKNQPTTYWLDTEFKRGDDNPDLLKAGGGSA
jgi:hypothetical protein